MAPLVPDIISNEFNLIIAIVLGFGFGVALEQGGFGSTRKLVGLFYGYDFTVLKVFFTAGVTAMVGITILNHMGLINVDIIYINPTFLWAAIVGGAIMGGGFIIGGFCPGTSVCAAASGKIDGWLFILGTILGVFAFSESFPLVKDLYLSNNLGDLLMFEMMGISRELFALLMVLIAVAVFILIQRIENKVNGLPTKYLKPQVIKYSLIVSVPVVLILITLSIPSRLELMSSRVDNLLSDNTTHIKQLDGDKLALELMHKHYTYNVIDIRSKDEYDAFHIPTAIHVSLDELHLAENSYLFKQNLKVNVFYGNSDEQTKRAYLIAEYAGRSENLALKTSAQEFQHNFYNIASDLSQISKHEADLMLFRERAAKRLDEIDKSIARLNKPVEKKAKRVSGGCS